MSDKNRETAFLLKKQRLDLLLNTIKKMEDALNNEYTDLLKDYIDVLTEFEGKSKPKRNNKKDK